MVDDLCAACAKLVALKDREAPWVNPKDWLTWALPFCPTVQYDFKAAAPEVVDAKYVVSSTRRWLLEHPPDPRRAVELMDGSDGFVTNNRVVCDQAPHQARIGALPLYCACEGKNRVVLFKASSRLMHAFITLLPFPEAGAMQVMRTRPYGTWQVACGERIVDVPSQQSLDVLLAYGVPVRKGARCDLFSRRRMERAKRIMLAQEAL